MEAGEQASCGMYFISKYDINNSQHYNDQEATRDKHPKDRYRDALSTIETG